MASKRKRQDGESAGLVHASRQLQVPGSTPKPTKKARKSEPGAYNKQMHVSSVNAIKKQIRDTRRKLERAADMPADVRIEEERALVAYEQDLAAAESEKIRQKMIKRYHMVRFFERQKATRQLKKLRKQLLEAQSSEEVEKLKKQMHIAEVDLNYTQYYPLSEAYIGIYPQKSSDETERSKEADEQQKPAMWFEVEKSMEEGTLDALRNRVLRPLEIRASKPITPAKPAKPKMQAAPMDVSGLNRRERRSQRGAQDAGRTMGKSMAFAKNEAFGASQAVRRDGADVLDEEDDSEGGFFENEE